MALPDTYVPAFTLSGESTDLQVFKNTLKPPDDD